MTNERLLLANPKPDLVVLDTEELNAETPAHLPDDDITPLEYLFVRNTRRIPNHHRRRRVDARHRQNRPYASHVLDA
jgi:hypothetical protein